MKLKYLNQENEARRTIAQIYQQSIKNEHITLPVSPVNKEEHVWHVFVIRTQMRDQLQKYLEDHGVQTIIHYPIPPHKQKAYSEWNHMIIRFLNEFMNEALSIPISPIQSMDDTQRIIEVINRFGKE